MAYIRWRVIVCCLVSWMLENVQRCLGGNTGPSPTTEPLLEYSILGRGSILALGNWGLDILVISRVKEPCVRMNRGLLTFFTG